MEILLLHTQENPGSIPGQNFIFVQIFSKFFFSFICIYTI